MEGVPNLGCRENAATRRESDTVAGKQVERDPSRPTRRELNGPTAHGLGHRNLSVREVRRVEFATTASTSGRLSASQPGAAMPVDQRGDERKRSRNLLRRLA